MTCFVMSLKSTAQAQDGTDKETFCLETAKATINWITAIEHFKSCELRVLEADEDTTGLLNGTTVATYAKNETNNFVKMRMEKMQ